MELLEQASERDIFSIYFLNCDPWFPFQTEYQGGKKLSHFRLTTQGKEMIPFHTEYIYREKKWSHFTLNIYIHGKEMIPFHTEYIYREKKWSHFTLNIYTGKRNDPISHWIYIYMEKKWSHFTLNIYTGKRNDSISHWIYRGEMKETRHHLDNESKCIQSKMHTFFKKNKNFFNRLWQNSLLWTTQRCSFEDRKNVLIFLPLKTTRKLTINQSLWVFQTRSCTRSKHKKVQTNAYL